MEKKLDKDFRQFIKDQPDQENEKSAIYDLFQELGNIDVPKPSKSMESNFRERLGNYKLSQTSKVGFRLNWPNPEKLFWVSSLVLRPSFAIIIFLLGIIGGMLINTSRTKNIQLISELQNTRQTLMLTLLDQPSATDRLKAVNLSEDMESPDKMVIQALLTTLNNDESVNVRLAAIEALFKYSNQPEVRKGLINAISNQNSPMILITLSKAMVLLQEKGSVEKLKQVVKNNQLEEKAKETINENIKKII